jgi:hypothetical protein
VPWEVLLFYAEELSFRAPLEVCRQNIFFTLIYIWVPFSFPLYFSIHLSCSVVAWNTAIMHKRLYNKTFLRQELSLVQCFFFNIVIKLKTSESYRRDVYIETFDCGVPLEHRWCLYMSDINPFQKVEDDEAGQDIDVIYYRIFDDCLKGGRTPPVLRILRHFFFIVHNIVFILLSARCEIQRKSTGVIECWRNSISQTYLKMMYPTNQTITSHVNFRLQN